MIVAMPNIVVSLLCGAFCHRCLDAREDDRRRRTSTAWLLDGLRLALF